jgi:preprotein translocase subunit SecB
MSETASEPGDRLPFHLVQIYLTSAELSYRVEPLSVPAVKKPESQPIQIGLTLERLDDGSAAQIRVRVTTDPNDGAEGVLYDFAVEYAGLIDQIDPEQLSEADLVQAVATMVFPFVRESVANLTTRGRFGPVWLNPFSVAGAIRKMRESYQARGGEVLAEGKVSAG